MPIYEVKSRGKRYDIPTELKDDFLKRNPDAQELYTPELVNNDLPKKEAKDMEVFDPTSLKELSKNTERFGLDGSPIRDVSVPEQAKGFLLNKDQAERVKERKSEHEQQNRLVLDQIEEFGHSLPESSYFDGESGRDYSTAKNYLYDAKKLKDRVAYRKGHGAVAQFLDAAGSELRDSEVLTMGGKEIDNALRVKSIIDKLEESKDDLSSLTDSERAVLRAAAIRQAAEEVYSNEQSISQRAGSATTGSVPFMIQYGLTSGFGAGAKTAVTKYVQSGLNRLISKGLLGKAVTKYVPKVAGATTQAAIMTPLQPGTYANIFNRRIGPADYGIDGSGDIEYQGHNSQTSTMEAMYKGITSSAIENFSEMTGAGFSQLGGDVFKLFSKQVPGLGRVFSKIPKSELMSRISKMTKRVGWNGTVEEFLEEQPATFLNALLVGDNEFSDLIDLEQQATIAVSVAAMGAGFTGLNEAGSVYEKRKIKNEYVNKREQFRTVFAESAPETIEMIESVISDCTPDRLAGTLNVLEQNVELTPEQSDAVRGYAVQSIVYNSLQRGYGERIELERERSESEIREQVNPDMDAIVVAETTMGDVRIVGGSLVLDENGNIDRGKSAKTIYIEGKDGRRAVPLFFINRIISNTSVEDALGMNNDRLRQERLREEESINFNVQPGHTIWIGQDAVVRSISPEGIYKIQLLDEDRTLLELSEQQLRDEMRKFEPDPVLESLPETASDVGVAETVLSETDKIQEHPVVFSTGKNNFEAVKRENNTGELNSIFESEKSAKAVYNNLSTLYPNLSFTVENRTDRNDPMARAQYAVSFKAAVTKPGEISTSEEVNSIRQGELSPNENKETQITAVNDVEQTTPNYDAMDASTLSSTFVSESGKEKALADLSLLLTENERQLKKAKGKKVKTTNEIRARQKNIDSLNTEVARLNEAIALLNVPKEAEISPDTKVEEHPVVESEPIQEVNQEKIITPSEQQNEIVDLAETVVNPDVVDIQEPVTYVRYRSKDINARFNEELNRQINNELPEGYIYEFGHPSQILLSAGLPDLPIELAASRLSDKSMQENHPFELAEIVNLPDAIQNPMAVFRSATHLGSYVVMTEIEHQGKNFVVAVQANRRKGRIEVNAIRSVHYRTSNTHMTNWINEGLLEYADKKRLSEWFSKQRYNSAEVRKLSGHAANIVKDFENKTVAQGNIVSEIDRLSEVLNTPVKVVRNTNDINDNNRKRAAKGWYDFKSDEVVIMLSNATSVSDVQATMLHEIVGHKGLRGLLGDSFDSFLDHVYDSLPESERTRIAESGDIRVGTEEYLATLAEQDVNPTVWGKISSAIREFFRDVLGVNLTLSDADLKYMLWKSKKRLTSQSIPDMVSKAVADGKLKERLFRDTERLDIETQARESGRWLLAPNSMPTLLNPESWITARTKGFNEWFGDWEKAARIEKLRNSEYIVLPEAEYALNRESAQRYALDRLRGEYTIKDTGERVEVRKEGVKKVTSHSMGNETHLRSIQSIPDLLENAIFICELPNSKNNGKYDSYRYYCCGVKMGDTDYTAKVTVGVKGGKKYYDHALTEIEKGKLIDNIDGLTSPFDGNQFTSSDYKDSKLFEILQTNSSKNVDVNGEPLSEMIAEYEKDSNIRFREVAETRTAVKAEYERRTSGLGFRLNEAHVDNMGSLKILQNIIEKESGKKIEDWENPYMNVTAIPSKSQAEAELFMDRFFTPIVQEIAGLEKAGEGYENIINYLLAKSGIERNEVFSRRDAEEWAKEEIGKLKDSDDWSDQESLIRNKAESVYKENLKRDYAGLTALQEELGDVSVEDFISEFEGRHETNRFWKYIKNATNEILNISYRSGEISKELRDQLSDRMQYYVPMRGFDEKIAGDVYEYFNSSDGGGKEKKAKGRVSKADDPVATIAKMAESAIVKGNKNILKQQFMNMARNHPTDLCSINRVWYVNRGTVESPHWVIEYPEYNTDVDIMADNVIAFEQQMRELGKNQMAYPDKSKLATGLKISPRQAQEHEIVVREAGKEYVIYVNGSPRVAQAVNGLLNPDQGELTELKKSEAANRISRYSENAANRAVHILDNKGHYYKALQRQLAANFTTRNPDFIASNLCRDMIWATTSLSVKEGAFYTGHFLSNVPKASGAILRHLRGKSDMSRQEDKYFNEFAMNGGRTGYAALHNIDEFKRETKRKIQKINGKVDPIKAFRIATRFFSKGNVWAEDMSRFSTYMTSRQAGRSIQQSVSDAKEVTVNFNRKGSGGAGNATMKTLFLFYNAAIQSLNQFAKLYKKNPAGMTAVVMGFSILGYLVALMNDAVDDEDKYSNLPDWIRHNNLCIPAGVGFVTNPLSIELRAFYGVGEMLYQYQAGRMEDKNITLEMLKKITELTPVDPFGGEQSFWPDVIKPLVQIKDNKNFFGRRIYNNSYNEFQPGFRKALSGTNGFLVNSAELLNEASGGDFGTPGLIDINPAIVEHLIESYAGGLGKFINRTYKTAGALVDLATGDEVSLETKDMPVVNRFYNISEDGDSYKVNERYYQLLDDMKRFNSQRRSYIEKIDLGEVEYDDKLNVLLDSEGEKFDLIKSYKKEIDSLMKSLEDVSEQEQTEIKNDALELKRQLIEELKD